MYKTALEGMKDELGSEGMLDKGDDTEVQIGNKLKRDAFLVFRALCKISMKIPPKESVGDPTLMKGKFLALELLKILLENAGAVFRTSERYFLISLTIFPLRFCFHFMGGITNFNQQFDASEQLIKIIRLL